MLNSDSIWESTFMQGKVCEYCAFNEPTVLMEGKSKRIIRECVAARAEHCPEVKRQQANMSEHIHDKP